MRLLLANGLMWGNAVLAGQALIITIVGTAMGLSWRRHLNTIFRSQHLNLVIAFFLFTGFTMIVVAVFGIYISRKLCKADQDHRAIHGSSIYNALSSIVLVSILVSAALTTYHVKGARKVAEQDLRYTMYQYFVDDAARPPLDHLHANFKCCGVNNFTDWTLATQSTNLKKDLSGEVPTKPFVPSSCCVVPRQDGTCFKYYENGCGPAVQEYLDMLVPTIIFTVVCIVVWLFLLSATSRKLQEAVTKKTL
ncbi:tetraspanin-9-like [Ornithodoros turicata]|uniref:tetraspanin-9-like n=1 Tax=Ornithodoros turicata TaxID=34597 RepID=UPI003138DB6C